VARAGAAGTLGLLVLAASGGAAWGAPCGRPDIVDMVPPDGASAVPVNATLAAHYQISAEYLGEDVLLIRPGGEGQVLPAIFDATEGLLSATPIEPLTPGERYEIRWPALRGLVTAAPGTGDEARFTAGDASDEMMPTFGGVVAVRWDVERRQSDCTESIEERMIFDVELGTAADDGGREMLTLLLFQTAGPRSPDRSIPVLARALPPEGEPVRVSLTTADGVGEICFAALVRDTTGRVSQSGAQEICVETTAPPFFRSCSVGGVGGGGGLARAASLGLLAAIATAIARRRRRRARIRGT
jgi:hypothetical protein